MNSFERKELKRAKTSKEKWKDKAKEREKEIRSLKDRKKQLEKSKELWKAKAIATRKQLKQQSASVSKPEVDSIKLPMNKDNLIFF